MKIMEKIRSEATAMDCDGESTKERSRKVPIEHKAVATGFKEDSDEKEVKAMIEETIKVVGMKEEKYTIDCPATPLTHAFVEFQSERTRDRYVRSANLRQPPTEWKKEQQAMSVEERFQWKRLGYFEIVLNKKLEFH